MTKPRFVFFALAPTGSGISGSDRIFIELARRWSAKYPVTIYITNEGVEMMKRQRLSGKNLKIVKVGKDKLPENFFLKYFYKIYLGIKLGFFSLSTIYNLPSTILYSSSDFWMDIFPGVILKLRFNQMKWIATWYQTAPSPLIGYREQGIRNKNYFLSAFLYWFSQLIAKPLIGRFADKVIVNNQDEKKEFPKHIKRGDTIVLLGAVPLEDIGNYKQSLATKGGELRIMNKGFKKEYDAVFLGRFHPQKGVVELVDIWKKVVDKVPDARLAMIGDGPLRKNVEDRIKNLGLEKNVELFGYLFDGPKKYKILSQSKIVVHPAFYDSGGMASAEAMAFGIPAVGFNLKAYDSYYPKGMIKVPNGNIELFAKEIIDLLENENRRRKIGREAKNMIEMNWSWNNRAQEILDLIHG